MCTAYIKTVEIKVLRSNEMRLGCMKLFVMHLLSCDSFCAPVWHTPHPLSPSPSTQHSKTANILFVICSPLLHCTCRVFEAINEARDLFLMMAEWQTARLVLYGVFNFYFSQNPHLTTSSVRWVHMESCAKWRQDLPSTTHALVCRISSFWSGEYWWVFCLTCH